MPMSSIRQARLKVRCKGGETKKAFVNDFLERKGFHLSTDEIDKLIEAAVLELNNAIWG